MSEVRFVVREAERDWSGTIHGSCADKAVAALSGDPVTLQELEVVVARFAKTEPHRRYFGNLTPGSCDEPYDAGLVVIDLVARLVVVDSTYSSPGVQGSVDYHDGRCATDQRLPYHLADDWRFSSDGENWRPLAKQLRRERAAQPVPDARAVFYGRAMLEFLARQTCAAFARRDEIESAVHANWRENAKARLAKEADIAPDQVDASRLTDAGIAPSTWPGQEIYASPFYDTIKDIHVDWLLTPRADLGGLCPRDVALRRHDHLTWDLQDRCQQWSIRQEAPPGLDESSHAFQHGGFGTHELVKYYDLIRELLWSCWERLVELSQDSRFEFLTTGDFLAEEVPRLEEVRDRWFETPDPECHLRTPRSIIDRERARLPEAMSGRDAMVDPDCPCCQMLADMPGPAFWHLDGSGMDDEFAFDLYRRTREEWDEEQRQWAERSRRFDAEWSERKRLGVTRRDDADSVWSRSFCVGDTSDVPLGVRVFGIGCRLAELIAELRDGASREDTPAEVQASIDQLNRDFGNLREVLQSSDSSLAEALIDPVLNRFADTLATLAASRVALTERCDSLTGELWKLLAPPPPEPTWDVDDDIPF